MTTTNLLNLKTWSLRMEKALGDQKTESRMLGALLSLDLIANMLIAGLRILNGRTLMSSIAHLSSYPVALAYVWMGLGLLVLPYFIMQTFGVWFERRRQITRLACRALLAGGVLWAFFAYLSRNIDSQYATGIFIGCSLISTAMSALLASSINTAQIREEQHNESHV